MHPLKKARLDLGYTQAMLADFAQVGLATIKRAEAAKPLRIDMIRLLCDYFAKEYKRPVTPKELGLVNTDAASIESGKEEQPETHPPRFNEIPSTSNFYGRDLELDTLQRWIDSDHCTVLAVLGLGGIGKTSIVTRLVERAEHTFESVLWISLQNAPPPEEVFHDCIQFFSHQQQITLPSKQDQQISMLLRYLQIHRSLLVLDNMESVLQPGNHAGEFQPGYEAYGAFLQRMGQTKHQSCLVLTSREKPKEIAQLEGRSLPVRSMHLTGLGHQAGQMLLEDAGLFSSHDSAWRDLITLYAGIPLYLRLVAEPIHEVFGGNIAEFLKRGKVMLGDIHDPLDLQFTRLSSVEKDILYWLAIEREPVSLDVLLEDIVSGTSEEDVLSALGALRRRFMIEIGTDSSHIPCFFLQPVILEYVTNQFVSAVVTELETKTPILLKSHLLLKAQAKEYVRESQTRIILGVIARKLVSIIGKKDLHQKIALLLSSLRETHADAANYTAGNILNILIYLRLNPGDYDFSNLHVLQAYLRGVAIPGTNFEQANLAGSAFTDTFGSILSVALSVDGHLLAAGTANGEIRVWDTTTGTPMYTVVGHVGWVWSVAFSPDGKLLASGSEDNTVRIWDLALHQCTRVLRGHENRVRSVAFSPDGTFVASGSEDETIRIWDVKTGVNKRTLDGYNHWVRSIAFSFDGKFLANGGDDQVITLWDVETGQCIKDFHGHTRRIWSVAFSPDGKFLASGGDDQVIKLWDIASGQCVSTLQGHTDRIWSIAFGMQGRLIASGSDDRTIRLWDRASGKCTNVLKGHSNRIWSIALDSTTNLLVSGSDDQTIRLWNVETGQCTNTLQGYVNWIWFAAFSADGEQVVSCDETLAVRLWRTQEGRCIQTLLGHEKRIRACAFSPDSKTAISCSEDSSIRIWDTTTGKCINTLIDCEPSSTLLLSPHATPTVNRVWSVAFSPQGSFIASGNEDTTIRLWTPQGQCFRLLKGHTGWVWSVAFSPDEIFLASAGEDATIRIWKSADGTCQHVLYGHHKRIWSVAFSPAGDLVASGGDDNTILLWNIHTQRCIQTLKGHTSPVRSVAFSHDSAFLASASEDKTIRIWDLNNYHCVHVLRGHTNRIMSVVFHPRWHDQVLSGSHDGTLKLWDTTTGSCLKTLQTDRPYERMNITGIRGVTETQKASLRLLGAVENAS